MMDLFAPVSRTSSHRNSVIVKGTIAGYNLCLPFHLHGLKGQWLYGLSVMSDLAKAAPSATLVRYSDFSTFCTPQRRNARAVWLMRRKTTRLNILSSDIMQME